MAKIWACVQDPGGMNCVIPVVHELLKDNHVITLLLYGTSKSLIQSEKAKFITDNITLYYVDSINEFISDELREGAHPELFLTSMCTDGGLGSVIMRFLKGKCPTVSLQDYWGGGLKDFADNRPDYIVVNDEIGAKLVLEAWGGYDSQRIKILGYPAFDKYSGMNVNKVSLEVKRKLGMTERKWPVVLVAGQGDGTGNLISEVVFALDNIGEEPFYVIPRPHPRTKVDYPEQMQLWQEAIARLNKGRIIVDFFEQTDTASLLAASDIIVSMFSTVLIEAAVLRKIPIAVLYEDCGAKLFKDSVGGLMNEFPLVELACCKKADSRTELCIQFYEALGRRTWLSTRQQEVFQTDGRNARRVADFVTSLL